MSWAAFKKGRSVLGAFSILVVGGIDALILQTLPLISDIGIAAVRIAVVGIAARTRQNTPLRGYFTKRCTKSFKRFTQPLGRP
jgi:hypothetical protein